MRARRRRASPGPARSGSAGPGGPGSLARSGPGRRARGGRRRSDRRRWRVAGRRPERRPEPRRSRCTSRRGGRSRRLRSPSVSCSSAKVRIVRAMVNVPSPTGSTRCRSTSADRSSSTSAPGPGASSAVSVRRSRRVVHEREHAQQALGVGLEEPVAPRQRGAEVAVAVGRVARTLPEDVDQRSVGALDDLGRTDRGGSGRRQLDGQRQALETAAELGHRDQVRATRPPAPTPLPPGPGRGRPRGWRRSPRGRSPRVPGVSSGRTGSERSPVTPRRRWLVTTTVRFGTSAASAATSGPAAARCSALSSTSSVGVRRNRRARACSRSTSGARTPMRLRHLLEHRRRIDDRRQGNDDHLVAPDRHPVGRRHRARGRTCPRHPGR